MARSRNIKPGFFTNEDLVEFDFPTRLLFVGLWTVADKSGRLQDRPKKIKIDVFPADNVDVDAMLQTLHNGGFIARYEIDGGKFIQITNWTKHQNPHHTEKASEIPAPNGVLTVKETLEPLDSQKQDGEYLADSGFLIPDSLIPDSPIQEGESASRKSPAKRSTTPHAIPKPDDVDQQTWDDWRQLRKDKKATVTLTVVDGARSEAEKAGMTLEAFLRVWCRRGSQGLEAAWLKTDERGTPINKQEALEQRNQAVANRWASNPKFAGAI